MNISRGRRRRRRRRKDQEGFEGGLVIGIRYVFLRTVSVSVSVSASASASVSVLSLINQLLVAHTNCLS